MKRTMVAVLLAAAVAQVSACGGKKKEPAKEGATAQATDAGKPAAPPGPPPPAPHADVTSALWALAPADTVFGLVIGDGVGAKLRTDLRAIVDDVGARPFGKHLNSAIEIGKTELGFDVLDPAGWKSIGIDDSKGAAMFATIAKPGAHDEKFFMILPVVDRDAFRAKTKGKVETVDGKEVDRLDSDLVCAPQNDRYVCAKTPADLALVGAAATGGKIGGEVKALPADTRGDLELYADVGSIADAADELAKLAPFGKIDAAGLSVRLEPDGVILRGFTRGATDGPVGLALRSAAPRADFAGRSGGATTLVRFTMADPKVLFAEVRAHMPVGGVDMRTDLVDQLTGELQVISAGKGLAAGVVSLGIADATKVQGALSALCAYGKTAIGQPGVPIKKLDIVDKGCKGEIDLADAVPNMTLPVFPFDLKVDGKQILLTVGDVDPARLGGNAADDAGSFETHAMLAGPATFVSWSRGLDQDVDALPDTMQAQMKKNEPLVLMDAAAWLGTAVYELGTAVTIDAAGAQLVVRATTFAGDPPEARAAYVDAIKKRHDLDRTGYQAALVELAKKFPATKAGKRAKLESEGTPLLGPGAAFLGAGAAYFLVNVMHGRPGDAPPSGSAGDAAPSPPTGPGFGKGKKKDEAHAPSELKAPPAGELKSPPGTP